MLTQKRVKELFDYAEDTGNLVRRKTVSRNKGAKKGQLAGSKGGAGYLLTWVGCGRYLNHRLIWLWVKGVFPEGQIDHINGIKTDNRISNLRDVTHQENHKNRSRQRNNISGITGVGWLQNRLRWQAQIKIEGKQTFLGHYVDFFEACCVRKSAENKYNYHPNHGKASASS